MDRKIANKNKELREPRVPPAGWSLYVLRCGDGSLYAGIALDVDARVAQHAAGTGARYTRGRGPLTVVGRVACADKGAALSLELRFKRLTRAQKLHLLARRPRLSAWAAEVEAARATRARGAAPA
ncbi:MAG TPA: GIY-YIG nuclease family protein [Polyangiaceae bacterium]|nr:GIY-YIG nuclease family protein [Polyangiaceae bacterium]